MSKEKKIINWRSVGIVSAIIIIVGSIVVALINGYFTSKTQPKLSTTASGNIQSPITTFNSANNVTINMPVSDSATKNAIQALENKLNNTNDKVELTKKELGLLSLALKDLDERTSGIEKLPDGRTKIGKLIAGKSSKMISEAIEGLKLYDSSDFANSLLHLQRAIKLLEDSQSMIEENSITEVPLPETKRKVYYLAALTAHRLIKNDLASEYAKKSVEAESIAENNALLAVTLLNIGKLEEASKYIEIALKIEPNNVDYIKYKEIIQEKEKKNTVNSEKQPTPPTGSK